MFFIFHVCVAINVVLYIIYCHDASNYLQNKLKSFFHHQFGVIIDNNKTYTFPIVFLRIYPFSSLLILKKFHILG